MIKGLLINVSQDREILGLKALNSILRVPIFKGHPCSQTRFEAWLFVWVTQDKPGQLTIKSKYFSFRCTLHELQLVYQEKTKYTLYAYKCFFEIGISHAVLLTGLMETLWQRR